MIQNNIITDNWANEFGGGLYYCSGSVLNNTITGNSATYWGVLDGCSGRIRNCILWGNTAPGGPEFHESSIPTCSCIQGWTGDPKSRSISEAPQFVDADGLNNNPGTQEDNDYQLAATSPRIDVGLNEDWMWRASDLDGNPHLWCGTSSWMVDMGAYEHGSFPSRSRMLSGVVTASSVGVAGPEILHNLVVCGPFRSAMERGGNNSVGG